MTKNELMNMIDKDLKLNHDNLESMLYRIPMLHSKYLRLFMQTQGKLRKVEKNLSELYLIKYNHYKNGKELLDKKEIQFHIMGDENYSLINFQMQKLIDLTDILDRTVKRVGNLSFDVRNLIEYLVFMNGGK